MNYINLTSFLIFCATRYHCHTIGDINKTHYLLWQHGEEEDF